MVKPLTRKTNPNKLEIVDAINERLMKSRSLTSVLLTSSVTDEINFKALYGFILVLDDHLEELDCLFDQLNEDSLA